MQLPARIQQGNVFNYCSKRGLDFAKPTLATLLAHRDPKILTRIDKDYISFADPLFKIFANIAPPVLLQEGDDGLYIQ